MNRRDVLLVVFALLVGVGWLARGRFRAWSLGQLRRIRRGSRRIRTANGTIEYQQVGDGAVVLLVHGAPGGYDAWRMYTPLMEAGYSLLSPSRPGYLRTPLRSGRTFTRQADLLIALMDTLAIETAAVVGFSMGGPVALDLAHRYPHRINKLVLQSALTHLYALDDPLEEMLVGTSWLPRRTQGMLFWLSHRLLRYFPRAAARNLLWASYSGPDEQGCMEALFESPTQRRALQAIMDSGVPLNHRQRGYDNDLQQLHQLQWTPLEHIHIPVLVLHSRYDASVPVRHATYAHEHLPHSQLALIEGCGHFTFMGREGKTAMQTVVEFLGHTEQV
ncbi:MAG: alpha/beta hydrolase [Chloroflexota bacterium]